MSSHPLGRKCTELEGLLGIVVMVKDVVAKNPRKHGPTGILGQIQLGHIDEGAASLAEHAGCSQPHEPASAPSRQAIEVGQKRGGGEVELGEGQEVRWMQVGTEYKHGPARSRDRAGGARAATGEGCLDPSGPQPSLAGTSPATLPWGAQVGDPVSVLRSRREDGSGRGAAPDDLLLSAASLSCSSDGPPGSGPGGR